MIPSPHRNPFFDSRGDLHALKELPFAPQEILISRNVRNAVRGLHRSPYAKMIYVIDGVVKDYVIEWTTHSSQATLNVNVLRQGDSLVVPAHAAHGFCALENSVMMYLLEKPFDSEKDQNVNWSSPDLGLPDARQGLPLPPSPILSPKDSNAPYLNKYDYLVLGASGYLGSNAVKHLRERGKYVFESTARLESHAQIYEQIQRSRAQYVICAAGISGRPTIDWSESHEAETFKTNYLDVLNLIETCEELGVHLTYFGSGAVYSGSKSVYTEDDEPDFREKVYSRYRCMLEESLRRMPRSNVLYLRIMYPATFDGHPKCFRTKMLARRENVHAAHVSITSVPDLFPCLPELIERKVIGVLNFVCNGTVSLRKLVGEVKSDVGGGSGEVRGNYELCAGALIKLLGGRVPHIEDVVKIRC